MLGKVQGQNASTLPSVNQGTKYCRAGAAVDRAKFQSGVGTVVHVFRESSSGKSYCKQETPSHTAPFVVISRQCLTPGLLIATFCANLKPLHWAP